MNGPDEARSRPFIAALQVSLDGYVAGPEGELDWVDSWADSLALVGPVDAFVLGRGMFDNGYEAYWDAALADPETASEMFGREPYPREVDYAQLAHGRRTSSCPRPCLTRRGRTCGSRATSPRSASSKTSPASRSMLSAAPDSWQPS